MGGGSTGHGPAARPSPVWGATRLGLRSRPAGAASAGALALQPRPRLVPPGSGSVTGARRAGAAPAALGAELGLLAAAACAGRG